MNLVFPNLTTLDLKGVTSLSNSVLVSIGNNMTKLKRLLIGSRFICPEAYNPGPTSKANDALQLISKRNKDLEFLHLSEKEVSEGTLKAIAYIY